MRTLILILLILFSKAFYGQLETPAIGLHGDGVFIKKDSSGEYFHSTYDTSLIYFISKGLQDYKLWKNHTNLILSGNLGGFRFTDYAKKFGQWKEYYDNGKIKLTGSYDFDHPVGLWNFYYPDGKVKKWFTISKIEADSTTSYCKAGQFEEYYENGSLKVLGFYKVVFDTLYEAMSVPIGDDGSIRTIMARGHRSVPDMTWIYYKINGEIERKVTF